MRLQIYLTDHSILRFHQRIDPTLSIPRIKRRILKAQELPYKDRKVMAKMRPWRNEELRNAGDKSLLMLHDKQAIYILRLVEYGNYNVVTVFSKDMVQQGNHYGEDKRQAEKRRQKAQPQRSGNHKRASRQCWAYARGLAPEAPRPSEPRPR
jgi:hypothetical protein